MRLRIPVVAAIFAAHGLAFSVTPVSAQGSISLSSSPIATYSPIILRAPQRDSLVALATHQVGSRYRWGAISPGKAFDCSGLVKWVMAQLGINMPRGSWQQAKTGIPIPKDPNQLLPGDLLYFSSSTHSRVDHIGIYIGEGKFVHAANRKKGVIISNLPTGSAARSWWVGVRRVFTSMDEIGPLPDLAITIPDALAGS